MATSGSNTTWSSNGGHYVKVTWNETSQSTTDNRSAVTVRLYVGSKSGWSISDSSNSYSLTINGTTYSGSNASISQTGSEDLILTKDVTINHDSDGTKSFSMKGAISGLYFGSISGTTFSGTLDTIARKSTMSSSADMTAGWNKTVSISRASSSFNHIVQVYVTRGATEKLIRTESFGTSETSKTLEWSNTQITEMFNNGHGYWTGTKFILTTRSGTTPIGTNTYTGSLDWPSNNSVGSMQNSINVGSSFSVDINKASSLYSHEIKLTLTDGTSLATQSISSGTSFTMTPPAATIYSRGSNSTSVTVELWIRTVLTASTATEVRGWTREKASSVVIPNTPPTMGSMSYTELNTTIAGIMLTSGVPNPVLVQGHSHPSFTFTAASPKNSASIVNYTVSIGGESLSRTTAGALDFTPANLGGRTIKVGANTNAVLTATDSRGFTNSISIPVTYLPYSPPSVTVNAKRVNGFGDVIELTGSATISSLNGRNTIVSPKGFKVRYRQVQNPQVAFPATYDETITSTISGAMATMTKKSYTLSNVNSYEFEFVITDKLGSTTVKKIAGAGQPIAFIDNKLLSVGINMFPTISSGFQVGGVAEFKSNVTAKKLLVSNVTGVGDELNDLEVQSNFGEFKTFTRSSVVGNNESSMQIRPRDDLNTGLQIFTRKDSTGFWDIKDGITWLRYNQAGGNGTATGDITLTPGVSSGKIRLNAVGGVECAARLSGNLTHTGGYLVIERFSPSYGAGQAELWYRGDERLLSISSRNPGDVSASNINVKAHRYIADAYEAPANTTGYLQCSPTSEFRVTEYKTATNYRPIRASSFPAGSSINYKTNLEKIESSMDALEFIKGTQVFKYHLKSNVNALIFDKPKIGVIAEMVDPLIRDEDGVDTYSMVSISWAAIQQQQKMIESQAKEIETLQEIIEIQDKEVEGLREMVMMLMNRVSKLEGGR